MAKKRGKRNKEREQRQRKFEKRQREMKKESKKMAKEEKKKQKLTPEEGGQESSPGQTPPAGPSGEAEEAT